MNLEWERDRPRATRPRATRLADARRRRTMSSTARESDRLLGATEETLASASGTSRSGRATKEGYSLRALTVCVFVASCAVWAAFAKELSALSTLDDGAGAASGGVESDAGDATALLGRVLGRAWA